MKRSERGQASVEWSALGLMLALLFASAGFAVARTDAWEFGDGIVHSLVCAVKGGCAEGDSLSLAYGDDVAAHVRRYAPNVAYDPGSAALPIDFRRCRRTDCSDGSDAAREVGRSRAGLPVTAFTHVVDRRDGGGPLYLQYWFYYPESFTGGVGRMFGDSWPGYHPDDWEGVQIRISPGGGASARATAHGGYGAGWQPWTGWMRVAGGSHAGEIAERGGRGRNTRAEQIDLIPLERLEGPSRHQFAVSPPWDKDVYRRPESVSS